MEATQVKEILVIIGTIVSILVSGGTAIFAWKKLKPEIRNMDADTTNTFAQSEKTKAEAIRIYSDEIRELKEDQVEERELNRIQNEKLRVEIATLRTDLEKIVEERRAEQLVYREFISELLLGITKLTGQIQVRGEVPVWIPPAKTPFDKRK